MTDWLREKVIAAGAPNGARLNQFTLAWLYNRGDEKDGAQRQYFYRLAAAVSKRLGPRKLPISVAERRAAMGKIWKGKRDDG